ncbi:MAG: glycoside hydrolase family 127 protein, partial [Desulfovibrio sp.]|nr:glycoside hydrolase family 127 protein [Desulfovibrio sp.]
MEKTFDVTVQAMPTDAERVAFDAAAIDLGGLSGVIADLRLPTKGAKDSAITWASSDPAHLSETGKVTRPIGEPATVTLTATVSYGEASETREYTATILPVYEKLDAVKAEQVSVTTKVGIAPALPAMVLTTFEDSSTRMVKATWPTALSGADFAEAKEYTVLGRLVDFDVEVAAKVTAVEELETPAAEARLLKLSDVTLDGDDTIYAQNMGRALEYLKVMDADRMLYNFRKAFGQDTKGAQALAGWDEPTGLLRGHSTGHFMSALAEAYASTGDEEYKQKLDYMIDSMRELQLLSKGKASEFVTACTPSDAAQSKWSTDPNTWGEGFISAYSPDQFALLEQYTPYATIWAPYYTMHKLLAGFLDSYVYAGNETGLQIAKDLGLWVYDRLSACTAEQRTKMWAMYIAGEYGGMNEVLARLYEITGDERLLTASRMFDNTAFFDGLAENKDTIQGRHANQHIPQIVGAIHEYAATGDPYYYNVAKNFWEMATARYAYSIGGVGTGESFKQPYRQGNNITGSSSRGENCETCAAYNMLKLTRDIYVYDPDNAAYMDYYERTVLNQIAASQSHNSTSRMHNGCTYMLPIDPGQRKTYDSDYGGFTCCNGTGMENHVIYQIAAYAKTDDTLYVNLYMPSTAEWEEKGVTIKQETQFPSEDSKLTVSGSGSFKMKIRVPYWATAGFTVKVNGQTVCTAPEPSSYVEIDRVWADGDVVDIHMPYTLYLDKTPDTVDGSVVASLMYGPIVMVAKDNRSRYTAMNWYSLNLNDTNLEKAVSIVEPAGTGNVPHFVIEGLDFYPMYDAYNYRYHAYVKLMAPESVLNPEYLEDAVASVAGLTEADFSPGDWAKFQAALADARALLENPAATQLELFDAQQALEDAAAKAGEPEIPESEKGLKDYFKDYFRIGTATEVAQVNSEVGREFMLKHFNSVTCENDMKPQHTLDQAGSQAAGDNITVKV